MADAQAILNEMGKLQGVSGAAVVDGSGAIVQSTIASAPDDLSTVASEIFTKIGGQLKRMDRGTVSQLVLETEGGLTLLSGLASGEMLIVFAVVGDSFNLGQLMEAAAQY